MCLSVSSMMGHPGVFFPALDAAVGFAGSADLSEGSTYWELKGIQLSVWGPTAIVSNSEPVNTLSSRSIHSI